MSFFDFLKVSDFKQQIASLEKEKENILSELTSLKNLKLSTEQMTAMEIQSKINELVSTKEQIEKNQNEINQEINTLKLEKATLEKQIFSHKKLVEELDYNLEAVQFGLYTPKYDCVNSMIYKEKLDNNRSMQKIMIKNKTAVNFSKNWEVNGSKSEGSKMINDAVKMILLSFNNECEAAINKVKYNNIEAIEKRIRKSAETLNNLNKTTGTYLDNKFIKLKIDELYISYEYEVKKQEEKEILREQREKEREEKALQKEVESKKKKLDKEISHMGNAIEELEIKLLTATDEEKHTIQSKIEEIRDKISTYENEKIELDYRLENLGAGYVYIISNIGSFGPDVFKIGVTRRLDPMDRVHELGDASVPFKFDVHAIIFSYKAYELETELHRVFDKYKINMVNNRKEFFKISIDDIEKELEKYKDLTIDFNKVPEAKEYNESLKIKQTL